MEVSQKNMGAGQIWGANW